MTTHEKPALEDCVNNVRRGTLRYNNSCLSMHNAILPTVRLSRMVSPPWAFKHVRTSHGPPTPNSAGDHHSLVLTITKLTDRQGDPSACLTDLSRGHPRRLLLLSRWLHCHRAVSLSQQNAMGPPPAVIRGVLSNCCIDGRIFNWLVIGVTATIWS